MQVSLLRLATAMVHHLRLMLSSLKASPWWISTSVWQQNLDMNLSTLPSSHSCFGMWTASLHDMWSSSGVCPCIWDRRAKPSSNLNDLPHPLCSDLRTTQSLRQSLVFHRHMPLLLQPFHSATFILVLVVMRCAGVRNCPPSQTIPTSSHSLEPKPFWPCEKGSGEYPCSEVSCLSATIFKFCKLPFQIFNAIGQVLLQFSKFLCSTVYLLSVISRTRTLVG